ncbi:MAG: HYC_CC_PP family protein [Aequorivita sp.]
MNSFLHKSIAVALATLVLFTTMSFTVNMHYCGDMMVDFSVVDNAATCGMEHDQSQNDCENEVQDDSCCSDKQIVVEGQDNFKVTFDTLTFEQQVFVATFFHSYINLFDVLDTNIVPFRDYKPPLLTRDIQKLHETYLI